MLSAVLTVLWTLSADTRRRASAAAGNVGASRRHELHSRAEKADPDAEMKVSCKGMTTRSSGAKPSSPHRTCHFPEKTLMAHDNAFRLARAARREDDKRGPFQQRRRGRRGTTDLFEFPGADDETGAQPGDKALCGMLGVAT